MSEVQPFGDVDPHEAPLQLEALEPLDIRKCTTISAMVDQQSRGSFGARMLGETAATIAKLAEARKPPTLIYDRHGGTNFFDLLLRMVNKGFFDKILTVKEYQETSNKNDTVVILGRFSEMHAPVLYGNSQRTIFINNEYVAKPGQISDGYFPDAVYADPELVMPMLNATLDERLHDRPHTARDLVFDLRRYGGVAQTTHQGAHILRNMVEDKECERWLTLSGAMTVAQMSYLLEDMISEGMFDSVTSTGALMAHGLMPGMGLRHYKHNPVNDDVRLARHKLNRVTDTLEPETNFDHAAAVIDAVLDSLPDNASIGTAEFHSLIGKHLAENFPGQRGILKTAFERSVPIFVPAFVDSELGNDVYTHNLRRHYDGRGPVWINPQYDQQLLVDRAKSAKKMGIFTVGGGVPRNHIQNVAPLLEIANSRVPEAELPTVAFSYGVRIAPDQLPIGNLGSCTYNENTSWRKFLPDARKAEIQSEATLILPLLMRYVMETRRA